MAKETSYQKLKRELKESQDAYKNLYDKFRSYSKGNIFVVTEWDCRFKMEDDFERMIWMGDSNG